MHVFAKCSGCMDCLGWLKRAIDCKAFGTQNSRNGSAREVITGYRTMRFFLAGIMQGSHTKAVLHDQDYRRRIRRLIAAHFPGADVYDPRADHTDSINYDESTGREVFFEHNEMCREVDVLLAFVPEASMGTAIEMWEAYRHGAAVITISPMTLNWAVKFLSHELYADVGQFEQDVRNGRLARRIGEIVDGQRRPST